MKLRNRITRATATGALVLTAPFLSACGMSFATDQVYTQAAGANDRQGSVDVLNALIVATEDGSGTFIATLANNETNEFEGGELTSDGDDGLTGISAAGDSQLTAQVSPVEIPAGGVATLADDTGIPVEGESVRLGHFVTVELTFENAAPVTIQVPVVANNGAFAGQDGSTLTPTTKERVEEESSASTGDDH